MTTTILPEVLTHKEAAKFLRIHPMTLYVLSRAKKLPVRKMGGQWRYSRTRLEQWMYQGGNA